MELSFIIAIVLMTCLGATHQASAMKIQTPEFDLAQNVTVNKFKLHITEKGVRFDEEIEIDEANDVEYMKVPRHNGLSEGDYLFDFKTNMTVTRAKKERVCYITPLPKDLPRPNVLARGLETLSGRPPNHKIEKTVQQWRVRDVVDKRTLRQEVRDFCGQFKVYRLEPFAIDSLSVEFGGQENAHKGRTRRSLTIKDFNLCHESPPTGCNPNSWSLSCRISSSRCVYYTKCELNLQLKNALCSDMKHVYNSIICCNASCSK